MKLPSYKYILALADYSLFIISFLLTEFLYNTIRGLSLFHFGESPFLTIMLYISSSFIFILIWQFNNLYKLNIFLSISNQITLIFKAQMASVFSLIVLSFLFKLPLLHDSRIFLLIYFIILFSVMVLVRVGLLRSAYKKFARSWVKKKIVIIGAGRAGMMVAAKLLIEEKSGLKIVGFLDDNRESGEKITDKLKVIGKVSDLIKCKEKHHIKEVIIAIDKITYERLIEIIELSRGANLRVKLASELFEIIPRKFVVDKFEDLPLIDVSERVNRTANIFIKNVLDRFLGFIGMIILSPFFLLIGIGIKLTSEGPILYKQTRIGRNGVTFLFYKFRSMEIVNGEDEDRKKQMIEFMKNGKKNSIGNTKVINKNRVTKIGSFLRKTSLDELPQLINVLRGEMSLVGPRPCLPYEYANYDEWHKKRLSITPGCTGLWQVSGRSKVSFKDSVVLDIYYLNNMSPWLDLQIIFKTIPVMLFCRGGE